MAPATNPDLLTSLQALREAARENSPRAPEISLPERPGNVSHETAYSNSAIGIVSVYTTHLYNEHGSWSAEVKGVRQDIKNIDQKVDRFEQGAKAALSDVSGRLDEVEGDLKSLKEEVNDVQSQLKDVQSQLKDVQSQVKDVQSQFESFQRGLDNTSARQINALRKWLKDSIEPVYAPARVQGKYTFTVSPDFPRTVSDCWRLLQDIPALVRLALHYSVSDWERWQRDSSEDTDRTDYMNLEDAVAAHPDQCLKILVSKWGLQYSDLEHPRKRSARFEDDKSVVRRWRIRRTSGSDIHESVISEGEAGVLVRQDRITHLRPPQPIQRDVPIQRMLEEEVLAQYPLPPGYIRTSFESAELGWQASLGTKTSSEGAKSRKT